MLYGAKYKLTTDTIMAVHRISEAGPPLRPLTVITETSIQPDTGHDPESP